jgi:flagellin
MAVINTNIAALNAQRNLMGSQNSLNTALQRLSSGLRINSAKDDAAGLAIASRMGAQISGLNQAVRNANDAVSLSQTAEGALSQSSDLLGRMRDLAVQSANDTNSGTDRAAIQQEVSQLQQELNRVANETEFNGKKLLDGSFTAQQFQVGANANQTIAISMSSAKATDMGDEQVNSTGVVGAAGSLDARAASATIATASSITAQNLTVSGSIGSKAVAILAGASASTVANSVNNQTENTGVSATARTEATLTAGATGSYSFDLTGSNTTAVTVSVQINNTSDLSKLADAINAKSAATGITAIATGGNVSLVSSTGDDIGISNESDGTSANASSLNLQAGTYGGTFTPSAAVSLTGTTNSTRVTGQVAFNASQSYTVKTDDTAGNMLADSTGAAVTSVASKLSDVGSIDVGSQTGANNAISVIDGAMDFVNDLRAKLGAVQNRVDSTVQNLSTTSENLSAAKSRIEDADFAAETGNLTRAQVLQQAGTAMLAQANALPNQVLTLLR